MEPNCATTSHGVYFIRRRFSLARNNESTISGRSLVGKRRFRNGLLDNRQFGVKNIRCDRVILMIFFWHQQCQDLCHLLKYSFLYLNWYVLLRPWPLRPVIQMIVCKLSLRYSLNFLVGLISRAVIG